MTNADFVSDLQDALTGPQFVLDRKQRRDMTGRRNGLFSAKQTGRRQHVLAMEGQAHVRSMSGLLPKATFIGMSTMSVKCQKRTSVQF
jgi:hypothetical protein